MLFLVLGVLAAAKGVHAGCGVLRNLADAKRLKNVADMVRREEGGQEMLAPTQPDPRMYASEQERILGEAKIAGIDHTDPAAMMTAGLYAEAQTAAVQKAEERFKKIEPFLPHCWSCNAPVVDMEAYQRRMM